MKHPNQNRKFKRVNRMDFNFAFEMKRKLGTKTEKKNKPSEKLM